MKYLVWIGAHRTKTMILVSCSSNHSASNSRAVAERVVVERVVVERVIVERVFVECVVFERVVGVVVFSVVVFGFLRAVLFLNRANNCFDSFCDVVL